MKTTHTTNIQTAADLLHQGEVVAFPTETVYGLGANALSDAAVQKIFTAKGRPADNPLIVHIGSCSLLPQIVADVPPQAQALIDAFWPGPLTIVLPKTDALSNLVTGGLSTVGVRQPAHDTALALLQTANLPIAAPSANLSGRPSPTTAQHVLDDLSGKVAAVLDGAHVAIGLESTVIDCTVTPPVILRPGGITAEQIATIIGNVVVSKSPTNTEDTPKSPGMKYTHYAPQAPMTLVIGDTAFFQSIINRAREQGNRVGILVCEEHRDIYQADEIVTCGSREDSATTANRLYHALRTFDAQAVDIIYAEPYAETGLGTAIMNRLRKACGDRVIEQ